MIALYVTEINRNVRTNSTKRRGEAREEEKEGICEREWK